MPEISSISPPAPATMLYIYANRGRCFKHTTRLLTTVIIKEEEEEGTGPRDKNPNSE